ncbi:MAG: vitamin B12 dependent methionine synthase [Proteobacteria bacterium]|nr:vitamin B12 dependent methionine synthase [Pseudomonadota bacterium]
MEILEGIPIHLNPEEIGEKLLVNKTGNWDDFQSIFEIAETLISAKAAYEVRYVDEKLKDAVIIDGVRFVSRVMRKNLDKVGRVFPYVVTIGAGLEDRCKATDDLLEQYYLDTIGNIALVKARKYLDHELRSRFAFESLSFMSPGSLADWPIEEQKQLFLLFEGVERSIGVRLNDSCLMIPRKSVSGIFFPTEVTFYNCQLCPRDNCVGRKAGYNENLAREYGINVWT